MGGYDAKPNCVPLEPKLLSLKPTPCRKEQRLGNWFFPVKIFSIEDRLVIRQKKWQCFYHHCPDSDSLHTNLDSSGLPGEATRPVCVAATSDCSEMLCGAGLLQYSPPSAGIEKGVNQLSPENRNTKNKCKTVLEV